MIKKHVNILTVVTRQDHSDASHRGHLFLKQWTSDEINQHLHGLLAFAHGRDEVIVPSLQQVTQTPQSVFDERYRNAL